MDSTKKCINLSPEIKANRLSKLLYCWLFPLFKQGYNNDLEAKDMYNATRDDLSESLGNKLERYWNQELIRAKKENGKPSLLKAIRHIFIKPYAYIGIELFIQTIIFRLGQPVILAFLIDQFNQTRTSSTQEAWIYATILIVISFAAIISVHRTSLGQNRIGMQCRVATSSLIYKKLLRLNKSSTAQSTAGQIINLLSNDVSRFEWVPQFLHFFWIMPAVTIIAGGIMFASIGYAVLAGLLIISLQALPLQGHLSRIQAKLRLKIANRTDHRVQLMSEIIGGIRVIKMHAWEVPFEKMVSSVRKLELDKIADASYLWGCILGMSRFNDKIALFLTLVVYVVLGNHLSGDKVFSMAQYFSIIYLHMCFLYPCAVVTAAQAKVSIQRIEDFMLLEEKRDSHQTFKETLNDKYGTIVAKHVSASWLTTNPIVHTLTNINLHINRGSLYAIVGPVGAGKSSLLQLFLNELPVHDGELEIIGGISYASQDPWLFTSSVRDNILFGLPFIESKYNTIISVCALQRDFELLPNGDNTLVGERGTSLSGGQKARINLARAIYREADIFLLDDPLSAVDAHVSKHLFQQCIVSYLRGKTRILVTHQLQFLQHVDQVVIINNGKIQTVGNYEELADKELASLNIGNISEDISPIRDDRHLIPDTSYTVPTCEEDDEKDSLETQELMEKGEIASSVYVEYFRNGGGTCFLLLMILVLVLAQAFLNIVDIWLTYWTNSEEAHYSSLFVNTTSAIVSSSQSKKENGTENVTINLVPAFNNTDLTLTSSNTDYNYNSKRYMFIYVYTGLIIINIVLTYLQSVMFVRICLNASKGLHKVMFRNVLTATTRFFDINQSGRILNRFSKDMGTVDEPLPRAFLTAVQTILFMFGILIVDIIITPWFIVPSLVLGGLSFMVRKIYLASAQNIKRLEASTKSPMFSHVSASINGLSTIRASGAESMITKEFDILQDQNTAPSFLYLATSEAFGFYLDIITVIFFAILTLQFLIFDDGSYMSGTVGLILSQSLNLAVTLQFGMRQTAEVAAQMTSVERIIQYTNLDLEGPFESVATKKPNYKWPNLGKIVFKDLTVQYDPTENPVIHCLNIEIVAGSKVGIVGRTGAGKSSLIAALFRLVPTEGSITIDNVDIKEIGLHDLRNKISIIPQDPILFTTTIRYNLDPFEKHEDRALWKALEDVELKDQITDLNHKVTDSGSNFSVGQKQLICLARAILRNNNILVMDEATANVDHQTDELIQETIRRTFKDCTVITIAHRLNTVMDSDKILVLDAGDAVEYGTPIELLQDENGHFTKMLKETGSMEYKLRKIAGDADNQRRNGAVNENGQSVVSVNNIKDGDKKEI